MAATRSPPSPISSRRSGRRVWRELMEINPKYSFAGHVGRLPFRNQADVDRLAEGLGKAGIAQ
jgi:adenylate cyclase